MNNNITALHPLTDDPDAIGARFIHDELKAQRWSLRLLQAETGIPKSTLAAKFAGRSPMLAADIRLFADILGRDPIEFYAAYLAAIDGEPTNLRPKA